MKKPITNRYIVIPIIFAGLLIIIGALVSQSSFRFQWQGPSTAFKRQYDLNRDGEISRAEWISLKVGSNLSNSTGNARTFVYMDCDANGRITWPEYHNFFFKGEGCTETYLGQQIKDNNTSDFFDYPFPVIITENELESIGNMAPGTPDVQVSKPIVDLVPGFISEAEPNEKELDKINFECSGPAFASIPNALNLTATNQQNVHTCKISNQNTDLIVTMLVLKIKESYVDLSQRSEQRQSQGILNNESVLANSIHTKPIYITPDHSSEILFFSSERATILNIELIAIRKMGLNR